MLGGIVVSIWGTDAAFIIDSLTFVLSTLFLVNLTLPQTIEESVKGPLFSTALLNIKPVGFVSGANLHCSELSLPKHRGTSQVEV